MWWRRGAHLIMLEMTPTRKRQGLLPVENWIPVPSRKLAKRHKRLAEKLRPKEKKYKPPAWLVKERREADRKYKADREGALMWIKYYEKWGKRIQTDPLLTFQHLGPPPKDEKVPPPIKAPNGELLTLSDLDAGFSTDTSGEIEGEKDSDSCEDEDVEEDLPLSRLCSQQKVGRTPRASLSKEVDDFLQSSSDDEGEDLCHRQEQSPRNFMEIADQNPISPLRKSTRRAMKLESLAEKARARKAKPGSW